MKIPVEILLELARLQADIAALANNTAKIHYEIYKKIKFADEEDPDYGADRDCEKCSE